MFDKRLLALVDGSGRMIAAIVGLKWLALVANIVVFVSLGLFIQQALAEAYVIPSAAPDVLAGLGLSGQTLLFLCVASIVVRVATSIAAQRVSAEVSGKAKKLIRGKVYDKLVKMGPSYTERIASSQAVQIGVEGVEQLEVYFGSYLPQFFYALLAPLTLFVFLAPFVLLDEPTSNLDSLSEAQVLKALHRHCEGKTMVLVSHRASTSSLADECYMFER